MKKAKISPRLRRSPAGTPGVPSSGSRQTTASGLPMRLIPDKTAGSVVRALNTIERKYGKLFPAVFKSITVDNGSEFADCAGLEQSVLKKRAKRTKMYYCHPYCSSERGSNEKQNQMIRRKFPKGTNFDKVSPKEVKMVEDWLNRYPRKILGWYSSADMFRALIEAV